MPFAADYSFARPDPAQLKAAGYEAVLRYLAPDNTNTHGKIIFPAEYQALHAAGLKVVLNWEWSTTRATQGYAAGQNDARAAEAQADQLGYPVSAPIYYSNDTGDTIDQIRPYYQGVWSAHKRPVGYYGGWPLGEQLRKEGTLSHIWCANAASWSGASSWQAMRLTLPPTVHLVQHLDHPLGFAGQIDHNEILRTDYLGEEDLLADERYWLQSLFNATFNFQNKSGLTTIMQSTVDTKNAVVASQASVVQAIHDATASIINALPAGGGGNIDAAQLTTLIHQAVVDALHSVD